MVVSKRLTNDTIIHGKKAITTQTQKWIVNRPFSCALRTILDDLDVSSIHIGIFSDSLQPHRLPVYLGQIASDTHCIVRKIRSCWTDL